MKSLGGSEDKDGDKKEAPDEGEEAVHTDPGKKKAVPGGNDQPVSIAMINMDVKSPWTPRQVKRSDQQYDNDDEDDEEEDDEEDVDDDDEFKDGD